MFYDGGLRVPFIARWPGVIKAGSTSDLMVEGIDLYPTFAEFAAAKLPDPAVHVLDGESIAPVLRGETNTLHRKAIYYHFPGYLDTRAYPCSVIIKQTDDNHRYKLIYSYEDEHYELYALTNDLGEKTDLLQGNVDPAILEGANDLNDDLNRWLQRVHPLYAKLKSTGAQTPLPIAVKEAMKRGNHSTRRIFDAHAQPGE